MTYDSFETSVEGGRPVEVYEITAGSTTFLYTSAEDDVTLGATTYMAVEGLQRGDNQEGPDRREHDFQIDLPTIDPLAQLFTATLPGYRIRMVVKRFHRDDTPTPGVVTIFDGYIQSAKFEDNGKRVQLTARPTLASIGRQIPRRTFQSSCNHVLYDPTTCKADDTDPANRASALSVASQVGNVLTVSSGLMGVFTDGDMDGGMVEVVGGSDYRLILSHTGNALTLLLPFSTTPASVNVFRGCAHTVQACKADFDNVLNFGGFAFVPTKNPFETGIL